MIQVGLRLHDTEKGDLQQRLDFMKEQGFTCSHVALTKAITEFSTANSALTPGLGSYIRKSFQKRNIDIAVLGCYLNLANPNEEQLKKIIDTYKATIRFASYLGCNVVGTETGAPNETYEFEEACHSEGALQTFIKNLRPVVEYAEKFGIIIAIEPVYVHIVNDAKRAKRVLDEINSPNLQILFDPVNILSIDNYKEHTTVIKDALEIFGDDIVVFHIKDFVVESNSLKACAVGTGLMDYTDIKEFIKKEKPYIHATLENVPPSYAKQACEIVRKW